MVQKAKVQNLLCYLIYRYSGAQSASARRHNCALVQIVALTVAKNVYP